MQKNLFYNKFIACFCMFRAPCAHRQEVKIVLYSLWYHHTYRRPSRARDGNLFIVKQILCIKLVNYQDKCTLLFISRSNSYCFIFPQFVTAECTLGGVDPATTEIRSMLQLLWPRLLFTNTSDYTRLQANAAPYRQS